MKKLISVASVLSLASLLMFVGLHGGSRARALATGQEAFASIPRTVKAVGRARVGKPGGKRVKTLTTTSRSIRPTRTIQLRSPASCHEPKTGLSSYLS
jgi:hypothetical protein